MFGILSWKVVFKGWRSLRHFSRRCQDVDHEFFGLFTAIEFPVDILGTNYILINF